MNVLPIVVLYNVDFHETNAYRTFLSQYGEGRILIYENSPEPQNQRYESEQVLYYHNPQNGGVSGAYNYGADVARRLGNIDFILLLDEDTCFEPNYFSMVQTAIEGNPNLNLFVPQVLYAGNQPFSPIRRGTHKYRGVMLSEGTYSLKDYLPVNSGACIRLSAFETVKGYKNNIRLDFADFDFFSRMAVLYDSFYCLGITAYQSFSNEEKQTDKLYRRYKFYIEGARVARKNPMIRTMVFVEVLRHTLALTARTRSFKFIHHLIRNFR